MTGQLESVVQQSQHKEIRISKDLTTQILDQKMLISQMVKYTAEIGDFGIGVFRYCTCHTDADRRTLPTDKTCATEYIMKSPFFFHKICVWVWRGDMISALNKARLSRLSNSARNLMDTLVFEKFSTSQLCMSRFGTLLVLANYHSLTLYVHAVSLVFGLRARAKSTGVLKNNIINKRSYSRPRKCAHSIWNVWPNL